MNIFSKNVGATGDRPTILHWRMFSLQIKHQPSLFVKIRQLPTLPQGCDREKHAILPWAIKNI
jgi:hypothetical protein